MIRYFAQIILQLVLVLSLCLPVGAESLEPVMYMTTVLLPDNNIVKISWQKLSGNDHYTIEKWEAPGTNYWIYDLNKKYKAVDKQIVLGGKAVNPVIINYMANSGIEIVYYDDQVKPGHTYLYRINGGIIGGVETNKKAVKALTPENINEISGKQDQSGTTAGEINKQKERQREYEKITDYPERLAADLIMALPNWLVEVVGLYDPMELVYEIDLQDSLRIDDENNTDQEMIWNIFNKKEFEIVAGFYDNASKGMPIFMAVGIVIAGLIVLFNSSGSSALITARSLLAGIVFCAILLKTAPYLISFFFDINKAVITLCHGFLVDNIGQSFLNTIYNKDTRSIGSALMALIGCISIGIINFQFAVRKLFIAILIGILPIALINSIFPSRRSSLVLWLREFSSYVFMPAGLAVGLAFFIGFINSGNFWITLVCLISLPTISTLVRSSLGLGDSSISAGIGSTLGMGAVFSLGNILSGGDTKSNINMMSDNNSSSEFDKGLVPGRFIGRDYPGIGSFITKAAMTTAFRGAGGIGGSILTGAMFGDALTGLDGGTAVGKKTINNLQESSSRVKAFVKEVKDKGFEESTGIVDNSMLMDPGVTASLAIKVLGNNNLGEFAALSASSASRGIKLLSPLLAPMSKERVDLVRSIVSDNESSTDINLRNEFNKIKQSQNYRRMFEKIQKGQYSGGKGGVNDSCWR